jgi:hypothetical protein
MSLTMEIKKKKIDVWIIGETSSPSATSGLQYFSTFENITILSGEIL